MSIYLISLAAIIFACIFLDKVSNKLGVPALLAFLVLGLIVGWANDVDRTAYPTVEALSNFALFLIIFYGGFGARWKAVKSYVAEASLLASLGVIITVGLTFAGCYYLLGFEWKESLLVSAILGSTDAASIFSILKTRKLNLCNGSAPILEMESGSNDPFAYILTVLVLALLSGSVGVAEISWMLVKQVGFGALFGLGIGYGAQQFFKRIDIPAGGMDSLFIMAIAIVAYALPGLVDGNGFLSVYIAGVMIGNSHVKNKKELVHFFDGIITLVQMGLFFVLGLLAHPATMYRAILPAVVILLIMTFVARPAAVHLLLLPFRKKDGSGKCRYPFNQRNFLSLVGLRGAASIVFVIVALAQNETLGMEIYNVVFCVVILSISIQGSLIPFLANRMGVIDDNEDVSKSFNDFSDDANMMFGRIAVTADSSWNGMKIADLDLPKNLILVLVLRDGEKILPKGRVTLHEGDEVIAGLRAWELEDGVDLTRHKIPSNSPLDGVLVKNMPTHHDNVILTIDRDGTQIIPTGKTVLHSNDLLFILKAQKGVLKYVVPEAEQKPAEQ